MSEVPGNNLPMNDLPMNEDTTGGLSMNEDTTGDLPRITLVTPSFNHAPYLEQCIASVLDQGYPNLEYMVVDGGSTDGSPEIIAKHAASLDWWVSEPDLGPAHAVNKALDKATGEWFNWINSDDCLEPGALTRLAEIAAANPGSRVICGNCRVYDSDSGRTKETYRMKLGEHPTATILNRHINQPSTFYRREVLNTLEGLNESLDLVFDAELWYRFLAKYGQDGVVLTDTLFSHFRDHPGSLSGTHPFEEFFGEEMEVLLFLAGQFGFPEHLRSEIFGEAIRANYRSGPWDTGRLDPDYLREHLNRRYYKRLYYKQKYREAGECIGEMKGEADRKIGRLTGLFGKGSINALRGMGSPNHSYLENDLTRQVNLPFRLKSKVVRHLPRARNRSIPVIINNRNRLDFLLRLTGWLEERGMKNIYIIDNQSGYPPLLEYYRKTPHTVFHLDRNTGHDALWHSHIYERFNRGYYIYTDPDILPVEECPPDFLEHFLQLLGRYPEAGKVGFGLKTDDLPPHFADRDQVVRWERQFVQKELEEGVYEARIDTTFALYRPGTRGGHQVRSLRTGGKYMARHLPWYLNSSGLPTEEKYYITHSSGSSSWYHRKTLYETG